MTILRQTIIDTMVQLTATRSLWSIKRREIAKASNAAHGTINYHFASMEGLRTAVIEHAIKTENLPIIAEAMARKHPAALRVSDTLQRRAARSMVA